MNNSETYQQWLPFPELSGRALIDHISDSDEGLMIFLRFPSGSVLENRQLRILFDAHVAYRNMDESYRARTWSITGGFKHSLYFIEHSSWLKWLHEESLTYYKDDDIKHYAIFTAADSLDILSEFPPEVTWIK